jgi:hypothetical protein
MFGATIFFSSSCEKHISQFSEIKTDQLQKSVLYMLGNVHVVPVLPKKLLKLTEKESFKKPTIINEQCFKML